MRDHGPKSSQLIISGWLRLLTWQTYLTMILHVRPPNPIKTMVNRKPVSIKDTNLKKPTWQDRDFWADRNMSSQSKWEI
jgi:hypothetical protein